MTAERTVTMDQSDPMRGRVDRTRMGRRNPAEDIEATSAELAELRRHMARRTA